MPDVNEVHRHNPTFTTQCEAASIASVGMDTYQLGVSHFAKHLANAHTIGYMHDTQAHLTNGPNGEQVRAVEMNLFDEDNRGALQQTERNLDLAVNGRGFMVVDSSGSKDTTAEPEHGMKTSGSFQLDSAGYMYDEGGNVLMGARINDDGSINTYSVLSNLERIQVPMMPEQSKATENIGMSGILPADNVQVNDTRETAVDVYDSLGVGHQLLFTWKFLGPRMWHLTVKDSMGATLTQETAAGESWEDDLCAAHNNSMIERRGAIVNFTEDGSYNGSLNADTTEFQDWDRATMELGIVEDILNYAQSLYDQDQSITKLSLMNKTTAYANGKYTCVDNTEKATSDGMLTAMDTGIDAHDALQMGQAEQQSAATYLDDSLTLMLPLFSPTDMPQDIYVTDWLNSTGTEVGSADSTIALDPSMFSLAGTQYHMQTPTQDGAGSSAFKGISIDSDGVLSYEFFGQDSKPGWLIPLIHYPNNNAMLQKSENVLVPTPECGSDYVLAAPKESNMGTMHSKTIVQSNVNEQKALLGSHEMARAAEVNTTVYKIATELDKFIIQMIAQVS